VEDNEFCSQIGKNAYDLVATHYNNELLTKKLLEFYIKLFKKDGEI
jgi:hypothetical protein